MKLLVCLFLIVVLLEEYNCAPYTRSRSRHRHHHGLQHGSSRYRSPYKPTGLCGNRYLHPYNYTYHPWRGSRHCTWHGPRYSSRHCSALGDWHSSRARYYSRYNTRHIIPNTTPVDKTEDKPLTEVTPIYKLEEKTTARPEDKSKEEFVDKSTKKPLDIPLKNPAHNLVQEPVEKSTVNPTRAVSVTVAYHVKISEDKAQYMTDKETTEKPVEKSMVKPTLTIPVTAANSVKIPEEKPQGITIKQTTAKPVEKSTIKPTSAVTAANPVKMFEDVPQDVTDEKPLETKPVENASENHSDNLFNKPLPNSAKSSLENLSDYPTVSPFDYWPAENQSELSTENSFSVIKILN